MKRPAIWTLTLVLCLSGCTDSTCPIPDSPSSADLTTHRVPSEYATIQEAMDAAVDGDTVLVAPGTYEGPGNVELDPHGVTVVARSAAGPESTIIRLRSGSSIVTGGFIIQRGEGQVIEGFTFRDGAADLGAPTAILGVGSRIVVRDCHVVDHAGPAIRLIGSIATVERCQIENIRSQSAAVQVSGGAAQFERCVLRGNATQERGGAMRIDGASTLLRECVFRGNSCEGGWGGALHVETSSVRISGCLIVRNRAAHGGGAMFVDRAAVSIWQCTISENSSPENGGGIALCGSAASVWMEYTILAANCAEDLVGFAGGGLWVRRSAVDTTRIRGDGYFRYSTTIVTADPQFCRLEGCFSERESNYFLRPGSPCLDPLRIGLFGVGCEN